MPFTGNFTTVRLEESSRGTPTLFVEGRSVPPDDAGELYVSMPHGGQLLTQKVDAAGLAEWVAQFEDPQPPLATGDSVFLIGVSMRPAPCDPFVWQGSFAIESRNA